MKSYLILCLSLCLGLTAHAQTALTAANNFKFAIPLAVDSDVSFNYDISALAIPPEPGEPAIEDGNSPGYHSVWFKHKATFSGLLRLNFTGTQIDSLAAVYVGSKLSSLRMVARADAQDGSDSTPNLSFEVAKGKTYYITVAAYAVISANKSVRLQLLKAFQFEKLRHIAAIMPDSVANTYALPQDNGRITIDTSSTGSYTGRLYLGSSSYPFSGKWAITRRSFGSSDILLQASHTISRADQDDLRITISSNTATSNPYDMTLVLDHLGYYPRSFSTPLYFSLGLPSNSSTDIILHAVNPNSDSSREGFAVITLKKGYSLASSFPGVGYSPSGKAYTFSANIGFRFGPVMQNLIFHKAIPGGQLVTGSADDIGLGNVIGPLQFRWFKPGSSKSKPEFRSSVQRETTYILTQYTPPTTADNNRNLIVQYGIHIPGVVGKQFLFESSSFGSDRFTVGSLFPGGSLTSKLSSPKLSIKTGIFTAKWSDTTVGNTDKGSLRGLYRADGIYGQSYHKNGVSFFNATL